MSRLPGVLCGFALGIAGLALAACTTVRPASLPQAQHGYIVDCTGANLTWSHCYRKASVLCPRGYAIAQKSENDGGHIVAGDLYDLVGAKVRHRRLKIQCKGEGSEPDTQAPVAPQPAVMPASAASTYPAQSD